MRQSLVWLPRDRRTSVEVVCSRVEPESNPPFKYPSRQLGMGWESLELASRREESSVVPPPLRLRSPLAAASAPSGLLRSVALQEPSIEPRFIKRINYFIMRRLSERVY
jgi:hypothetical protein